MRSDSVGRECSEFARAWNVEWVPKIKMFIKNLRIARENLITIYRKLMLKLRSYMCILSPSKFYPFEALQNFPNRLKTGQLSFRKSATLKGEQKKNAHRET